ncbi:hypothetical protein B0H16DRAFT_1834568 [Mycena metata]|uniref:Uncharacterized protein n=1 Tax=Mycena metata TaxID=1033252 RepID=A0AAD7J0Z2_9AGAR|nr:hypothetical protein B0H16DRAFT_1834568 [Mycena metata]
MLYGIGHQCPCGPVRNQLTAGTKDGIFSPCLSPPSSPPTFLPAFPRPPARARLSARLPPQILKLKLQTSFSQSLQRAAQDSSGYLDACLVKTQSQFILLVQLNTAQTRSPKPSIKPRHPAAKTFPALLFFSRFLPPSSDSLSNNNSLVSVLEQRWSFQRHPSPAASLLPPQAPLRVPVIPGLPAPERQVMAWGCCTRCLLVEARGHAESWCVRWPMPPPR